MKRRKLYAALGAAGVLMVLVAVLSVSVVSAQEPTPESDGAPACGMWGRGRGLSGFFRGGPWTMFDTVAEALGLKPEELFGEVHDGKGLSEIAEAEGVEMETLQEALSAAREAAMRDAIAQAVEDGQMSQEQADWLLEGLDEGYVPFGRGFGRGFGRRPGMRGGGGFAPGGFAPDGVSPQSAPAVPAVPSSSSL